MYMGMAEEEDRDLAESWKADAEGILVFVRLYVLTPCFKLVLFFIDWFILRCCRLLDFGLDTGPPTKPTGYLQLLPCKHIPDYRRPKSIQYLEFPSCLPAAIFSTLICRLGQFTLVLKSGD